MFYKKAGKETSTNDAILALVRLIRKGKERENYEKGKKYRFQKYLKEAGVAKANFHALRHTFATRCVECGFEVKSLSEILGHSNVQTTLNKYVHSSFELKQSNMERLEAYFVK